MSLRYDLNSLNDASTGILKQLVGEVVLVQWKSDSFMNVSCSVGILEKVRQEDISLSPKFKVGDEIVFERDKVKKLEEWELIQMKIMGLI